MGSEISEAARRRAFDGVDGDFVADRQLHRGLVGNETRIVNATGNAAAVQPFAGAVALGGVHKDREEMPDRLGGRRRLERSNGRKLAQIARGDLAAGRGPALQIRQQGAGKDRGVQLVETAVQTEFIVQIQVGLPVMAQRPGAAGDARIVGQQGPAVPERAEIFRGIKLAAAAWPTVPTLRPLCFAPIAWAQSSTIARAKSCFRPASFSRSSGFP